MESVIDDMFLIALNEINNDGGGHTYNTLSLYVLGCFLKKYDRNDDFGREFKEKVTNINTEIAYVFASVFMEYVPEGLRKCAESEELSTTFLKAFMESYLSVQDIIITGLTRYEVLPSSQENTTKFYRMLVRAQRFMIDVQCAMNDMQKSYDSLSEREKASRPSFVYNMQMYKIIEEKPRASNWRNFFAVMQHYLDDLINKYEQRTGRKFKRHTNKKECVVQSRISQMQARLMMNASAFTHNADDIWAKKRAQNREDWEIVYAVKNRETWMNKPNFQKLVGMIRGYTQQTARMPPFLQALATKILHRIPRKESEDENGMWSVRIIGVSLMSFFARFTPFIKSNQETKNIMIKTLEACVNLMYDIVWNKADKWVIISEEDRPVFVDDDDAKYQFEALQKDVDVAAKNIKYLIGSNQGAEMEEDYYKAIVGNTIKNMHNIQRVMSNMKEALASSMSASSTSASSTSASSTSAVRQVSCPAAVAAKLVSLNLSPFF
jgi:hypothetical protein